MDETVYEQHDYKNPGFPLKFHLDTHRAGKTNCHTHWHEHIELLYVTEGVTMVNGNGVLHEVKRGEVIYISPNCIHTIYAASEQSSYYCITVQREFCDSFGVPLCEGQFSQVFDSRDITACFEKIIMLMTDRPPHYREETKATVLCLLVRVCREAEIRGGDIEKTNAHGRMITDAIDYLRVHFAEPVSVDTLSALTGFSKYYFCRCFKSVTGRTVVEYLNFLRVRNAKRLISSGQYNVGESARMSGFSNMSYFTRVYTAQLGYPPSAEQKMEAVQNDLPCC